MCIVRYIILPAKLFRIFFPKVMIRTLFSLLLLLCVCTFSTAQEKKTAILKGKLINSITKEPFSDLKITIPELKVFSTSDGEGKFMFSEIPYGKYAMIVSGFKAVGDTISVNVNKSVVDIDGNLIRPSDRGSSPESVEIPTIAMEENNSSASEEEGVSVAGTGLVIANQDPLVSTYAYLFGLYYFQPRGAKHTAQDLQINGITINDVETGNASWSSMGGLNDVFRGRYVQYGLAPSEYTFSGINGSAYISATAADQQQETRVTYTRTDRNYNNRVMVTHNSGLMKNGWAYSFSASKRWAEEGYVPGTSYDGYSYYGSLSKVVRKGKLSLTSFGSPTTYGKAAAATKEADQLAGTNYYNHDWGYQNGKVRNVATKNIFQPISILNYEYKPSEKTRWNTAIGYQFGQDRNGGFYYEEGRNPFGDYYQKLPSYWQTMVPPDSTRANTIRNAILNNRNSLQLDWDGMYRANYANTGYTFFGVKPTERLSIYSLADNVADLKKYSFNTNIEHAVNENLSLFGGIAATSQNTEYYVRLTDLLGGDYTLNLNQYAPLTSPGSPYNNLLAPSPVVGVGDKIAYDYFMHVNNATAWGQAMYNLDRFDFFAAASIGGSSFYRQGLLQNGLFPNNSYGRSASHNFLIYGIKGGADYKIDTRDFLFVNAAFTTTPPTSDNSFISAETRDYAIPNLTVQNNKSLEAGYVRKSSNFSVRAMGYVTDVTNTTEIKRFFNDDPTYYTYMNYVMQGVNTRSIGTELSLRYKLTRELSVTGVASVGQAFYTNRPDVTIYLDNDTAQRPNPAKAYIKNYYVGTGPQSAYTLGFNYRPRQVRNSYIDLNFNYFDRNYVEINPNRRTEATAAFYQAGSPIWHKIFDQEELPSVFTVDLRFGKTFQLAKGKQSPKQQAHSPVLSLSGSVNNLLNNTNIINYGFEQLRYDFKDNTPDRFQNKYMYGYGINFVINLTLTF